LTVSDRARRLSAAKSVKDIEQGDYVRRALGSRRAGLIEEVHDDGFAWVQWSPCRREYLPIAALRKIPPGGHELDARKS
jgi:hypothetical protein